MPELEAPGVLAPVDAHALARYCVTFVRWREAELALATHGSTYTDADGVPRVRPEAAIAKDLAAHLLRLEAALFMSPASRTKLVGPRPLSIENEAAWAKRAEIEKFRLS